MRFALFACCVCLLYYFVGPICDVACAVCDYVLFLIDWLWWWLLLFCYCCLLFVCVWDCCFINVVAAVIVFVLIICGLYLPFLGTHICCGFCVFVLLVLCCCLLVVVVVVCLLLLCVVVAVNVLFCVALL